MSSLSRLVGPIYMNPVYNEWGLYALASLIEGAMLIILVILVAIYNQLVPLEVIVERRKKKEEALRSGEKAL